MIRNCTNAGLLLLAKETRKVPRSNARKLARLITAAKQGDHEAAGQLSHACLPLVVEAVKDAKSNGGGSSCAVLLMETGTEAASNSIGTFDPDKGCGFMEHITAAVRTAVKAKASDVSATCAGGGKCRFAAIAGRRKP